MMESTAKASTKYLEELSILLRSQGFIVHPGETRDIDVELDGSTLCRINDLGNLGYFADKIAGKESVLDRIRETARSTREYMTLLEQAPPLAAEGLSEGYQLLAEFNGTVLAGHMTRYGAQFVTWEWVHNKTALWQGHYYGFGGGSGGYPSAKEELPYHATSGFRYETLTDDPEVRKAVDDILHDLYGEENPRPLADYGSGGMTMGGMQL